MTCRCPVRCPGRIYIPTTRVSRSGGRPPGPGVDKNHGTVKKRTASDDSSPRVGDTDGTTLVYPFDPLISDVVPGLLVASETPCKT